MIDVKTLLELFRGVINHDPHAYDQLGDVYEDCDLPRLKKYSVYWTDYRFIDTLDELLSYCSLRKFETYEAANAYAEGLQLNDDTLCDNSWKNLINLLQSCESISDELAKEALETEGPEEEYE